jgi:lysophospholipase L1-like esterase
MVIRKSKPFIENLHKYIIAVLVFFILVESVIRLVYFIRNLNVDYVTLPYVIGHDYGPAPPWTNDLRILEPDKLLIWKNRPGIRQRYVDVFSPVHSQNERMQLFRQFLPMLHDFVQHNPVWEISLNSLGFREVEFQKEKPPSVFRIICLGDSWTFGANIGQEQAYPQQLSRLLRHEFPDAAFEVLNLGVLGYSSFQGLELLKLTALDLNPDLLVIAFAMNDASMAGYRDKDMPNYKENKTAVQGIIHFIDKSETYQLLKYIALRIKHNPKTISQQLRAVQDSAKKPDEAVNYEKQEPWVRVSPQDYRKNIMQMISLAKSRQISVILLYNQLSDDAGEVAGIGPLGSTTSYKLILEEISRSENVQLVDSSVHLSLAKKNIEAELESFLNLRPSAVGDNDAANEVEVVFRVFQVNYPVPEGIYIAGTHLKLGNSEPNKIKMYDDGTHGDQRAGDKVWSYAASFAPGTKLFYVYTNSGREGKWEGLDVPYIRNTVVEAGNRGSRFYMPVETFGKVYMQADSWHTNVLGYKLIAKALFKEIKWDENVKEYTAHIVDSK